MTISSVSQQDIHDTLEKHENALKRQNDVSQEVGLAFKKIEQELERDAQLLSTFEKEIMSGDNLDVSPKDLFSHLSKTFDATSKKLYDDMGGLHEAMTNRMKDAVQNVEQEITRKVDDTIGHLAAVTSVAQDHNDIKLKELEAQMRICQDQVTQIGHMLERTQSQPQATASPIHRADLSQGGNGGL